MITNLILNVFFMFLTAIISILPNALDLPPAYYSALDTISPYLNLMNSFFPVDILFDVLAIIFSFYTFLYSFKFLNWTLNKLRGSG